MNKETLWKHMCAFASSEIYEKKLIHLQLLVSQMMHPRLPHEVASNICEKFNPLKVFQQAMKQMKLLLLGESEQQVYPKANKILLELVILFKNYGLDESKLTQSHQSKIVKIMEVLLDNDISCIKEMTKLMYENSYWLLTGISSTFLPLEECLQQLGMPGALNQLNFQFYDEFLNLK